MNETVEIHGTHKVTISQPAIRMVVQVGDQALPCADALPEWNSVDEWADGFAEIVGDEIRRMGGTVDQSALRYEFAKVARDAIRSYERTQTFH